ncbi:hypothetical protein Tco_0381976 [Tanacetum coccineum]
MTSICDMVGQYMQKKEEDKQIAKDQAAKDQYWKIPICYNVDDDENSNDHFNAESSLIESVLNRDNVISSSKIDFFIEEFTSELALIALITPGIVKADLNPKEDIRFIENLMETNTVDNSLPKTETFRSNLEEISSGSTTTRSDLSLPDYEAFNLDDDHIKEKSSGSTTIHANFSLPKYDSFIFYLLINPFPPVDRSESYHEEFVDELVTSKSPPGSPRS